MAERKTVTEQKNEAAAKGGAVGVVGVIVVIILAIGGWFLFNGKNDTPRSVGNDVTKAIESTRDVVSEVPQAASDAVTPGDQKTTRPNDDGSTNKLDQKK